MNIFLNLRNFTGITNDKLIMSNNYYLQLTVD